MKIKKRKNRLLVAALILTAVVNGCGGHVCQISEYEYDQTGHAAVCSHPRCTVVQPWQEHGFDGGVITLPATPARDGVIIYTCECGYKQSRAVKYDKEEQEMKWTYGYTYIGAYPRLMEYQNRIYLFADNKYALSYDGAKTFEPFKQICSDSTDLAADGTRLNSVANGEGIALPDGRIAFFYRANSSESGYSSIRMRISDLSGENFGSPTVLLENYDAKYKGGAYEPFPVMIEKNGKDCTLAVYISFDARSSEQQMNGHPIKKNSDLTVKESTVSQNIVRINVSIKGGEQSSVTVFEPEVIIRGSELCDSNGVVRDYSRPGMTVVAPLAGGGYLMVLENSVELANGWGMVIQASYSRDGSEWTTPQTVFTPGDDKRGTRGSIDGAGMYVCAAPYVAVLPSGQIAISFQTNVSFTSDLEPVVNSHDASIAVYVSSENISLGDELKADDFVLQNVVPGRRGGYSIWCSLRVIRGSLYALGGSGTDGIDEGILIASTKI